MADERTPDIVERLDALHAELNKWARLSAYNEERYQEWFACLRTTADAKAEIERLRASHTSRDEQPRDDRFPEVINALHEAVGDLYWMSGSRDFSPEGPAHKGWIGVRARIERYNAIIEAGREPARVGEANPIACNADTSVEPSGRKIG